MNRIRFRRHELNEWRHGNAACLDESTQLTWTDFNWINYDTAMLQEPQ